MAGLRAVPPQVCGLALGCHGLSGLLAHWVRLGAVFLEPGPSVFSFAAVTLALCYLSKLVVAPGAVWEDLSSPSSLAAVAAWPAVVQGLAVKFMAFLPLAVVDGTVLVCYAASIVMSAAFLRMNYRRGLLPDPSWFPGASMFTMTCLTVPAAFHSKFLDEVMHEQMLVVLTALAPLLLVVAYRLHLSKARDSVAPHAGMAVLMAPSSFYCFAHLQTGKPYGETLSLVLFAFSTSFFLVTMRLLYVRRAVWARAFHVSYVSFTFPISSTATAALLASERLPEIAGPVSRAWAAVLGILAFFVTTSVLLRFLGMLFVVVVRERRGEVERGVEAVAKSVVRQASATLKGFTRGVIGKKRSHVSRRDIFVTAVFPADGPKDSQGLP